MKRITAILFLTFICQTNILFSQTKTPYQKKIDEIYTEFCRALDINESLIVLAQKSSDWSIVYGSQDFAFKTKLVDREVLLAMMLAADKKAKDAEKLKNDVDRKRDADKKAKEDKEKQLVEEQKQKELQIQEERKKQEQIKLQEQKDKERLARIEAEKIEYYNNSDYVEIKNKVSLNFNSWLKQGEFEKTDDYENRLQFREMIFDSICHEIILDQIDEKMNPNIELGQYNPDKEYFPATISWRKLNFKDTIYIGISEAEKFKNQTQSYSIRFSKKEQDWCIYDNYFWPLRMFVENVGDRPQIEIVVPHDKPCSPLNLTTSEINLMNFKFEELKYEYDKYELKRAQFLKEKKMKEFQYLIKKAEDFEKTENLQESLKCYKNALAIEPTSTLVQNKITEITDRINEINRSKLILEAEELYKNGKLSSSKQKFIEANKIRKTNDITDLISTIENTITTSRQKHSELLSHFNKCEGNNAFPKYSKMNDDLENVKNGYGVKYNICLDTINNEINSKKADLKALYAEYLKNQNKEIWSDDNQKLLDLIISFNTEFLKLKSFEDNIFKALQNQDKKFLKILKEENVNDIIETVVKTN